MRKGFMDWWAPAQLSYQPGPERQAELDRMSYREYLLTPEWAAMRAEAMEVAGYRCQWSIGNVRCTETWQQQLQVHHVNYPPRGTERSIDVRILCGRHHAGVHGLDDEAYRTAVLVREKPADADERVAGYVRADLDG